MHSEDALCVKCCINGEVGAAAGQGAAQTNLEQDTSAKEVRGQEELLTNCQDLLEHDYFADGEHPQASLEVHGALNELDAGGS